MTNAAGRVGSALLAGVLVTAGCASSARRAGLNSESIRPTRKGSGHIALSPVDRAPADSLETVIGKIRELSARARPAAKHRPATPVESVDPELAAALLALRVLPSAAAHRRVAEEYVRIRVLDAAFDHYRAAFRIDPRDAAAYDGLARIWRDWKLPALALADARRAVYYAPHSAEAHNTLGTVFQAIGRRAWAKDAYRRSLQLDPRAAYALNNLGYVLFLEGDPAATAYFRKALEIDRNLLAARHNLALAYAADGRLDLAKQELREADPPPTASYNLGIINLARRDEAGAIVAFQAACRAKAGIQWACERYRELSARLAAPEGTP